MTNKEHSIHQSYCNKIGITVYPVVYSYNHYKIAIKTNNLEIIQDEVYKKKPDDKEKNWSNEIRNIYQIIYNKKHNIN
jgi:hypothetical protein